MLIYVWKYQVIQKKKKTIFQKLFLNLKRKDNYFENDLPNKWITPNFLSETPHDIHDEKKTSIKNCA